MSDQRQYMTLLGRQMEHQLDIDQQTKMDSAVKQMLVEMDDTRKFAYNLKPMNGTIHNRPPEQSIQMTERWRQMEEQERLWRSQSEQSDNEDGSQDELPDIEEWEPDCPPANE